MTTEKSTHPDSSVSGEATLTQEGVVETVQILENSAWYKRLSEDWLATLLGLLLVLLIVVHFIHSVP